jgi:hypothetical protein
MHTVFYRHGQLDLAGDQLLLELLRLRAQLPIVGVPQMVERLAVLLDH